MDSSLEKWLIEANNFYSKNNVPHRKRGYLALRDFASNHKCSLSFGSGTGKEILDWFQKNSPEGSHAIGPKFGSVFWFDSYFWDMSIPMIFGSVVVTPFDCLEKMPKFVHDQLTRSSDDLRRLNNHWKNCFDYAYCFDDAMQAGNLSESEKGFIQSADSELRGAISQLRGARPNLKAILGFRMATELFLKAKLIHSIKITERERRKLGHDIAALASRCHESSGKSEYSRIQEMASIFPEVSARYEDSEWPMPQVWNATFTAHFAAATFCRELSTWRMNLGWSKTG